jgi:hypothetical protein
MLITRNGLVPVRTAAIRPTNLATRPSENEASEAASVTPQEGLSNTINDPGNADLAITIGSTQPVAGFAAQVEAPLENGRVRASVGLPA